MANGGQASARISSLRIQSQQRAHLLPLVQVSVIALLCYCQRAAALRRPSPIESCRSAEGERDLARRRRSVGFGGNLKINKLFLAHQELQIGRPSVRGSMNFLTVSLGTARSGTGVCGDHSQLANNWRSGRRTRRKEHLGVAPSSTSRRALLCWEI